MYPTFGPAGPGFENNFLSAGISGPSGREKKRNGPPSRPCAENQPGAHLATLTSGTRVLDYTCTVHRSGNFGNTSEPTSVQTPHRWPTLLHHRYHRHLLRARRYDFP